MLSLFRECKKKQDSGSPCYLDTSDKPMTIWVKRFGDKESRDQIKDITEKLYGAFPRPNEVDDDQINAYWLAEYGVTKWENLIGEDDKSEIEYSSSNRRRIFLTKEYFMSLNRLLMSHAVNYENYLQDTALDDIENLKKK